MVTEEESSEGSGITDHPLYPRQSDVAQWARWPVPQAVLNLLTLNGLRAVRLPIIRSSPGCFISVYRNVGGREKSIGAFRVDNVRDMELCRRIQVAIDWVEGRD